jgi:hypothetical protein
MRALDSTSSPHDPPLLRAIMERLKGPGGFHNPGIAIALCGTVPRFLRIAGDGP